MPPIAPPPSVDSCCQLPRDKARAALWALDIWDLRSFVGQSARERAWNAAVRVAPCLAWLWRYNWKQQLVADVAAGVAVACLIVPQARINVPFANG